MRSEVVHQTSDVLEDVAQAVVPRTGAAEEEGVKRRCNITNSPWLLPLPAHDRWRTNQDYTSREWLPCQQRPPNIYMKIIVCIDKEQLYVDSSVF